MKFVHKIAMRLLPGMHEAYQEVSRQRKKLNRQNGILRRQLDEARQMHDVHFDNAVAFEQALLQILETHQQASEALMSLVALNEDGKWTTVFDADTHLPQETSDFLDKFVAQS